MLPLSHFDHDLWLQLMAPLPWLRSSLTSFSIGTFLDKPLPLPPVRRKENSVYTHAHAFASIDDLTFDFL